MGRGCQNSSKDCLKIVSLALISVSYIEITRMYTWKVNQHDSSPIYVNYKLSYIQNRKYIEEENKCGFVE